MVCVGENAEVRCVNGISTWAFAAIPAHSNKADGRALRNPFKSVLSVFTINYVTRLFD